MGWAIMFLVLIALVIILSISLIIPLSGKAERETPRWKAS